MTKWSIEIFGQTEWDVWVIICSLASLVLLSYIIFGKLWTSVKGWVSLVLSLTAIVGTIVIMSVSAFHTKMLGLIWTFVVLVILSVVFYLNLLKQLGKVKTFVLLTLRLIALALIVLMLFSPRVLYSKHAKAERQLIFVVDASGSMSFPDVQNGPTRMQSVWQMLRPQLQRIRESFIPQFHTFATNFDDVKNPEDFAKIIPDGKATDLAMGISKATAKVTRKDAAIIFFSDGIDNTSPTPATAARNSPCPIHTVLVGSEQAEPATMANVAVDNIETAEDFVVNHETKVKALIKSTALANRVVDVKMSEIDADGKPTSQLIVQKLVLQPLAEGQTVELAFKPKRVGVHRLAVWIDPIPGERSIVDNRQEFQGLALDPRIKILYIEGRARPEYRELNRALTRDPNVEVASLLRIQQDRFMGSGTVDGEKFFQMPNSPEEWKKFDVIIIGDLDCSFLSRPQQMAIEQLVSNGAGLLMIGGTTSFGPGSYKDTPIEKALPVFCGDVGAAQEKSEFVPRLTATGAAHPAMEGLAEWFGVEHKAGEKNLPPLRGNVVVPKEKNGAEILLVHDGRTGPDGKPQIVLSVQRYGQGRSAAFTADTTYLWYLPLRGMGQDSPYNRFWGQVVRWLAGEDVRNRQRGAGIEGLLNKSLYQMGESVLVRAMVRDDRGDATRYAQVTLTLKKIGTKEVRTIPLTPSQARTGMYEVTIPSPTKGDYTIQLLATKETKELGKQDLKFTVIAPADEMLKLAANPSLMTDIAKAPSRNPGTFRRLEQFPKLIDEMIAEAAPDPAADQRIVPLDNVVRDACSLFMDTSKWKKIYDLPMQAFVVLILLGGEWMLRRFWQLP